MDQAKLLEKLRQAFQMESAERLTVIQNRLVDLEKTPESAARAPLVEEVFREAHSLKGAARAVQLGEIESVCQAMEGVLGEVKQGARDLTPVLFDRLHEATGLLERLFPGADLEAGKPHSAEEIAGLVEKLGKGSESGPGGSVSPAAEEPEAGGAAEALVENAPAPERKNSPATASLPEQETIPSTAPVSEQEAVPSTALAPSPTADSAESSASGSMAAAVDSSPPAPLPASGTEAPPESASSSALQPTTPQPSGGILPPLPDGAGGGSAPIASIPTIRVPTNKLDHLLLKAEEMIGLKMVWDEQIEGFLELGREFEDWRKRWADGKGMGQARRQGKGALAGERRSDHANFFTLSQEFVGGVERRVKALTRAARGNQRQFDRLVDDLLGEVKNVIMVPAATILEPLPGMVRQIAREQNKQVDLVTLGGEIEVDRRILEEMKTPLIHLVRNAIDHGLETPEIRVAEGKPPVGRLELQVARLEGNRVEIRLSDDGRGIDLPGLRAQLVARDGYSPEAVAELDDRQVRDSVFHSGISTAPMITELSGRGLGLAIVRETVEKLGGRVFLGDSQVPGAVVSVRLPISLTTFRGVRVRVRDRLFILPSEHVEIVRRVPQGDVRRVENRTAFSHDGIPLSLVDLGAILGLAGEEDPGDLTVVVLSWQEVRVGFRVDRVIEEREVLVKGLGRHLQRTRHISGATILGSGRVVPILNVADLMRTASDAGATGGDHFGVGALDGDPESAQRAILVVEDSLTSRMLLKNILEASGYRVHTAMDGLDGLNLLKAQPVDLVVSDVEMPRMNGFELTEQIRADGALAHIPLILVTSLASQGDRERGVEAGANAYMVKAEFDQGNLLEVIEGLI